MKLRPNINSRQNSGFVLIIALVATVAVAALALSSFGSVESKIAIQRQEASGMQADLAAQAGLAHAKMMLISDAYWEGTEEWVNVGDARFNIETELVENQQTTGVQVSVKAEGQSGDGKRILQMDIIVSNGGSMGDVGAVFLSSNLDFHQGHINGNVLIPDAVGVIEDYSVDEFGNGTWTQNNDPLGTLNFQAFVVNHESYQYTENEYFNGSPTIIVEEDSYKMPAWNLDTYLEDVENNIVLNGVTSLSGMNTSETVVVVLEEGQTLTVDNCQLHGGLVVYSPADWDLRSGARNEVIVNGSNIGTGSSPHIGLMAPTASVTGSDSSTNFHGLCFWNSIHDLDRPHIDGALVVVNEVVNLSKMVMNQHPPTMGNLPDGISFSGDQPGLDFLDSGEYIN